ncbi:MAG: carboxypeptidase regulatory-like domain-containing protein, partial [Actinobacteria bacterium]|nr:carboxypeptidase regulatory-like domain-containing protein [Actinomycetota bacterium]
MLMLAPATVVVWNSTRSGHGSGNGAVRGDGDGVEEENPNAATGCGSGSTWNVKIGADAQAGRVNLTPVPSDVATLTSLTPNTNHRSSPVEFTTYTVTATLTRVYQEHDLDQHMSIRDSSGHFMLVELPDMSCINGSGSIFASQIARAHAELAAWSGQTPTTVQITGVGFFDAPTGQADQAPNQIELHPVLDINFNPGGPTQGSITGAVLDPQQQPIAGVQVVTNPATSTVSTDTSGRYALAAAPGTYTVTAAAPKFASESTSGITVTGGASTTANFTLPVASLPPARGAPYWSGWDIARGAALRADESGGYVLDGFGGIHPFQSTGAAPPPVVSSSYWNGWDIARGITLVPSGTGGYVVDGYGG